MSNAINKRIAKKTRGQVSVTMVKESLSRAYDELHSGQAKHNARELFKK